MHAQKPSPRLAATRAVLLLIFALLAGTAAAAQDKLPVYGFKVVHRYPHDPSAYTEGLFYQDGYLYESTGGIGQSGIRKVELESGKVVQQTTLAAPFYGEGIAAWQGKLIELTWQDHVGIVYDLGTLQAQQRFTYPGEGWALTRDASHLYMSDGTAFLRVLDPDTLTESAAIYVTDGNRPLLNLNEIEWVKGEIYANVWLTNRIARIDPVSGHVIGWIDLSGLFDNRSLPDPGNDVLNGIAYDAEHDRLFVTGKCWPYVYEIELVRK